MPHPNVHGLVLVWSACGTGADFPEANLEDADQSGVAFFARDEAQQSIAGFTTLEG